MALSAAWWNLVNELSRAGYLIEQIEAPIENVEGVAGSYRATIVKNTELAKSEGNRREDTFTSATEGELVRQLRSAYL